MFGVMTLRAKAAWLGLAGTLLLAPALAWAAPKPGPTSTKTETWSATWEASPEAPRAPVVDISHQTVRQIAHVTLGGIFVRVRFSNEFGDQPLTINTAHIALAKGAGAAIDASTDKQLLFGGKPSITIPPGARVVTDPLSFTVPQFANVAVSAAYGDVPGAVTSHFFSMQTSYMAPGDQTAAANLPGASTTNRILVTTGIDVSSSKETRVVVALGDSLTGGYGGTPDTNHRWPDLLAIRLANHRGPPIGVVNAGIGGNRLLHDFFGPNALARFDRDVLSQASVGFMIVQIGINDFGLPGGRGLPAEEVSADEVIAGYRQLIQRAHTYGIKVFIGTIPPFGPIPERPGYYSEAAEAKREAVNQWIRLNTKEFEGMIDFDAALRDPKVPIRLAAKYDSGDHLDPNDAGYQAMADAVEMRLFE